MRLEVSPGRGREAASRGELHEVLLSGPPVLLSGSLEATGELTALSALSD